MLNWKSSFDHWNHLFIECVQCNKPSMPMFVACKYTVFGKVHLTFSDEGSGTYICNHACCLCMWHFDGYHTWCIGLSVDEPYCFGWVSKILMHWQCLMLNS